ncbi:hypothetical protein PIB30_025989 [Stylosanthes scabra]|uniref:Uncharacterized protein n=1 Tax=Stylosanthes scabra TaxID=79078 RepID=A0ABU6TB13_9FABA|nr:hypothetical protein [Stylosanthes scabra]
MGSVLSISEPPSKSISDLPYVGPKLTGRPKSSSDPYKGPTISIAGSTQDRDHICIDLVRIYPLNNRKPPRIYKEEISSPPNEEGVPYIDHSGDEQRQNPQPNPQQVDLDLNATANGSQDSAGRNAETDGAQNGQPNSGGDRSRGRRSTSAFDRLGPGN